MGYVFRVKYQEKNGTLKLSDERQLFIPPPATIKIPVFPHSLMFPQGGDRRQGGI